MDELWCIHTTENSEVVKMKKLELHVATWLNLRNILSVHCIFNIIYSHISYNYSRK